MSIDLVQIRNVFKNWKNDQIEIFAKIEVFKFGSNFQVQIQKKAIKVKNFSAAARFAAAAHASPYEKVIRFEKSDYGEKLENSIFECFLIFEHERTWAS